MKQARCLFHQDACSTNMPIPRSFSWLAAIVLPKKLGNRAPSFVRRQF
ncbi:hypothetical protein [Moorena sp. SIO4A5]|nr:hypothetical protein [Moorena sp. SIO4A5]NEO24930.1 hypothetical protein [Moorena sp. SIO4A5]